MREGRGGKGSREGWEGRGRKGRREKERGMGKGEKKKGGEGKEGRKLTSESTLKTFFMSVSSS